MHKLVRHVRFSINPFLPADALGSNSFASKPSGEGLALFFELGVGLVGQADPATGFVVNVTDIDKYARQYAVPIFAKEIRKYFRDGKHIGLFKVVGLLREAQGQLAGKFDKAILAELSLKLNPFRKIAIDCEDKKMIYFSEKFEFAATHKLWNEDISQERNYQLFGKCANPAGHGHNYVIEVTVKMPEDSEDFQLAAFQKTIDDKLIALIDHKNLNVDVTEFATTNPTIENIAVFTWNKLIDKFSEAKLHCVTIWETDKTYCSYYG